MHVLHPLIRIHLPFIEIIDCKIRTLFLALYRNISVSSSTEGVFKRTYIVSTSELRFFSVHFHLSMPDPGTFVSWIILPKALVAHTYK